MVARFGRGLRGVLSTAVVAVVATTAACTAGGLSAPAATTSPSVATSAPLPSASGGAAGLEDRYVAVIRQVLPSVVLIRTNKGLGSGVVFDDQGHIVTNAHVVGTAKKFQVTASNQTAPMAASLVGSYPANDLAVIKLDGSGSLPPASFGDSAKLEVGDIALAMGNPLGLASSVTNGIVSALGRTVTEPPADGAGGATLPNIIQTSAAINPGNSGGALVDLDGQVIGIPTLAATDPELGGTAGGIGFAIPSNVVTDIAGQLIQHGKVINSHRAALGIRGATATDNQGQPVGAGIASVEPGGPAAAAGLQAGEAIVALNGQPTPTIQALTTVLAALEPGQQVPVEVVTRDGSKRTVQVKLGELPG